MKTPRREFLRTVGGLIITGGISGCTQSNPSDTLTSPTQTHSAPSDTSSTESTPRSSPRPDGRALKIENPPGRVRPDNDPERIPSAFECTSEECTRHDSIYDRGGVVFGDISKRGSLAFELRVNFVTLEYGDTVRITLQNVTAQEQNLNNSAKYNLEILTEEGWRDVRCRQENIPLYAEGEWHAPKDRGYEWMFPFSEEGIVKGHTQEDNLRVCPDLMPGRYRFTFFGFGTDTDADAAATEFDFMR